MEQKKKISLGLKRSYFGADELSSSESESDAEGAESGSDSEAEEAMDVDAEGASESEQAMETDGASDSEGSEDVAMTSAAPDALSEASDSEDEEVAPSLRSRGASAPTLPSAPGIRWGDAEEDSAASPDTDSSDPEADADSTTGGRLSKRAKRTARRREEEALREAEARLAAGDEPPQSVDEFERALIAAPNDSYLWVNYMAHFLQVRGCSPLGGAGHDGGWWAHAQRVSALGHS